MAFNLKKVLRALLFSTSQPLSVKDIQAAFTRYHEQAALPAEETVEESPVPARAGTTPPADAGAQADQLGAPADDASSSAPEPVPSAVPAEDSAAPVPTPSANEPTSPPEAAPSETAAVGSSPAPAPTPAPASALPLEEAELYQDVPSLVTAAQIREVMDEIALELRTGDTGLLLVEASEGYRLVTHPRLARWVRILRNEPPPVKLTQSVLETLAVIAYRQPVTRTEIEHIRGVSAEASLAKLMERELVYIVGRADLPGRPLQYGTTDGFLEFLGVRSLDELPASDVLSHKQIDEWLQNNTTAKPPTDAEMGLPLELGEGESPNLEPVTVASAAASAPAADSLTAPAPAAATPPAAPPVPDTAPHTSEAPPAADAPPPSPPSAATN